jgi:hypothetical protein
MSFAEFKFSICLLMLIVVSIRSGFHISNGKDANASVSLGKHAPPYTSPDSSVLYSVSPYFQLKSKVVVPVLE